MDGTCHLDIPRKGEADGKSDWECVSRTLKTQTALEEFNGSTSCAACSLTNSEIFISLCICSPWIAFLSPHRNYVDICIVRYGCEALFTVFVFSFSDACVGVWIFFASLAYEVLYR